MPRFALLIEYDGTSFVGWQRQINGLSIQTVLEEAASKLCSGAPVASIVAGRTDSGVHAEGQVVHIEIERVISLPALRDALNYHMKPHPVVVLRAAEVSKEFSARFSATGRSYRFRILNRASRPALWLNRVWHVEQPLDAGRMADAARLLVGRHDFTSFRAASCQARNPTRTLDRLEIGQSGDIIEIVAEARSFLHHQVRNMAGTLKLVGEGRWPVERVSEALAARSRSAAGPTAPPDGLSLTAVRYDPDPFA